MTRRQLICLAIVTSALAPSSAIAAEWFVAPSGTGTGSAAAPFGRVQAALAVAKPGDVISVRPGTYAESLSTVRAGQPGAPIVVRATVPGQAIISRRGRLLHVRHPHHRFAGLVFDASYAPIDAVRVESAGDHLVLEDVEVRRTSRDCIDMAAPRNVLIDASRIHHCLNAAGGRSDAHGVVAGAVRDLTIRNTEIHTFSGDGVQVDPARSPAGWDRVTIEGSRIWLEPLPAAENGFAAGVVPGENAVDTKADPAAPRPTIVVRDSVLRGFRAGLVTNMAALNLKEKVRAIVDRVTVYDCTIAFRLRGPGSGSAGATVTIANAVVYDTATAVRYEDSIQDLQVWNTTIGAGVGRAFQAAGSAGSTLDVRNVLVVGAQLPAEAGRGSNLAVKASTFVDAGGGDYHLTAASPAVDRGEALSGVAVDRDGVPRPQGAAYDVGAFERAHASEQPHDVVLYVLDASDVAGAWTFKADGTAAGGLRAVHPDAGLRVHAPLANPVHYLELPFHAEAGRAYRLWIRGRAGRNRPKNDSVFVQFTGSLDAGGRAAYRIGTPSALMVELRDCAACVLAGWGWQDTASGGGVLGPLVFFGDTGPQTIRIQTREDGLSIDQVVLSPATYLTSAPGAPGGDATILAH